MNPDPAAIEFRDFRVADREWVETQNIRHYTQVEGFDPSFATAVTAALDRLQDAIGERGSKFLIVETRQGRQPVGCVFFTAETPTSGRLRLFYLDRAYRGSGLGRLMLDRIVEHARGQMMETIRVSTFDRHTAACRLYQSAGFLCEAQEPSCAFGQVMRQLDFEKRL